MGDPTAWRLLGSTDGVSWTALDERSGEAFKYRLQTRAFKIANPGRYAFYRLDVTANTGDQATALSEVEFLARPDH